MRSACMPRECRSKNHSLSSTFIYIHLLCPNSWDLHGSLCGFIDYTAFIANYAGRRAMPVDLDDVQVHAQPNRAACIDAIATPSSSSACSTRRVRHGLFARGPFFAVASCSTTTSIVVARTEAGPSRSFHVSCSFETARPRLKSGARTVFQPVSTAATPSSILVRSSRTVNQQLLASDSGLDPTHRHQRSTSS